MHCKIIKVCDSQQMACCLPLQKYHYKAFAVPPSCPVQPKAVKPRSLLQHTCTIGMHPHSCILATQTASPEAVETQESCKAACTVTIYAHYYGELTCWRH